MSLMNKIYKRTTCKRGFTTYIDIQTQSHEHGLINWCLTPTFALFQLYRGILEMDKRVQETVFENKTIYFVAYLFILFTCPIWIKAVKISYIETTVTLVCSDFCLDMAQC
jgi:hypothetical protein